jgi:hypothetical protein
LFGYGVPSVPQGSEFNVSLSGYYPRSLVYTLSPTVGNQVLTALALGRVGNQSSYSFGAAAQGTYSLELLIIAYNGTGFTISYSGVWSPFDPLKVYTAPSIFLIMAGLAATYYFGTRIPRQLREEEVERELARDRGEAT